ncbi:MAG: hypothetical protein KA319_12570 [Ferruginibacter sp.]|nr:hypothetical protein [Ferruginibacter sp.]
MGVWNYFLLTLLIELPIILLLFKKDRKYVLLIAFLLNLFTWPLLHVLLFYTKINLNILEFCVALIESIGFYFLLNCSWKKAVLAGFLANGISYGIGIIINSM